MAEDVTAIEHLLQGRQALEREVARLTEAMAQLDSVIALFEAGGPATGSSGTSALLRSQSGGTVNATTAPRAPRRAPARRPARAAAGGDDAPRSIREHVLDMLAAEPREFGLAEIIDRIHGLGIQAHDDAVRSITIKLMKDGQVERVGRGQYRLAGGDAPAETGDEPVADPVVDDTVPDGAVDEPMTADAADAGIFLDQPDAPGQPDAPDRPEAVAFAEPVGYQRPDRPEDSYTPPLNLGQPWS